MKVLSINTYGGSLLLAAQAADFQIIGSYENEKGYGTDVQRLNFGGQFPIRAESPRYWGRDVETLREDIVIAHPPCSWASHQNNSSSKKGLSAGAFDCTRDVLNFATAKEAAAILIESVPGALEGARLIHDEVARDKGYDLYRIVQNAASFGVPQDRERFWAIFVRKDISGDKPMPVGLVPKKKLIRDVIEKSDAVTDRPLPAFAECLRNQLVKWAQEGLSPHQIDELLEGKKGFGMLNPKIKGSAYTKQYAMFTFGTRNIRLLNPDGLATVLLSDSFWAVPTATYHESPGEDNLDEPIERRSGRLVYESEYKEIMGFPRDYKFPEKYRKGKLLEYLSKGVCPPVAKWLLEEVRRFILIQDLSIGQFAVKPGMVLNLTHLR